MVAPSSLMSAGQATSRGQDRDVISLRRMTLGSGYRYLMESVATGDGAVGTSSSLTRYYAESGTPPGSSSGLVSPRLDDGRGVEKGSAVTEEHLFNLLGMCADPVTGIPLGRQPNRVDGSRTTEVRERPRANPESGTDDESDRKRSPYRGRTAPPARTHPDTGGRVRSHLLPLQIGVSGVGAGRSGHQGADLCVPPPRPSRSSFPTPSARSSTRARAPTAWSKKTSRVSSRWPSPTGTRGPATLSSTTTSWWPTAPVRSPTASGGRSIVAACSRAWSPSPSCTRACSAIC